MLPFSLWYREFLVGNAVFTSGELLMYLASADAVLRDYHDNVKDSIPLSLLFDIKGKANQPANPRKARERAERGVSARPRSKYCIVHLNNLLASDIHTYIVAPGITPAVPLPPGDNRQTSDPVLRPLSPPTSGNGGQQPSSVDTTAEILPVVDPFFWNIAPPPVSGPPFVMTSTSQHAVQSSELGFNLRDMGKLFL